MINLQETKSIKEKLHENPKDFQSIIDSTDLAICITDQHANFVTANKTYLKTYKLKKDDILGKSLLMVIPEEIQDKTMRHYNRFFENKNELHRKWIVKDGKGKEMEVFTDSDYNDKILQAPHKVTFVQFLKYAGKKPKEQEGEASFVLL